MVEDWRDRTLLRVKELLQSLPESAGKELFPSLPETVGEDEGGDLCAIFEKLSVLAHEQKIFQRKVAGSMKALEDSLAPLPQRLGQLEGALEPLPSAIERIEKGLQALDAQLCAGFSRGCDDRWSLPMAMLGRIERLAAQMDHPPKPSIWRGHRPWHEAWASARQAVDILLHHLIEAMKTHDLQKMHVKGQAFDPRRMVAIDQRCVPGEKPGKVIEEVAPGFESGGRVIRPAEVIVSKGS